MASAQGRGAQVRLDGEAQRVARGAVGSRLADNIAAQWVLEQSGDYADGSTPDGSTLTGEEAKDEVLSPGGRAPSIEGAAEAGAAAGTAAVQQALYGAVELQDVAVLRDGSTSMLVPPQILGAPSLATHAARKMEVDQASTFVGRSGLSRPAIKRERFVLYTDDYLTDGDLASVRAGAMDVDLTAKLQQAHADAAADKMRIIYGSGVYATTGGLTLYAGLDIAGQGNGGKLAPTTIRLLANSNRDVLTGTNAYSLFGTDDYSYASQATAFGIRDLVIDGNRVAQSAVDPNAQNGIALYGSAWRLSNVDIINVLGHGLRTEWCQYGETSGGLEACLHNVKVDTVGRHGWWNRGPHDLDASHLIVIDASQEADDTYCGLYTESFSNGRFRNLHVWHRGATTNRCKYAVDSGGGNHFSDSHFEGTRCLARHRGGDFVLGCNLYSSFGDGGNPHVTIAGDNVIYSGCHLRGSSTRTQVAFQIGEPDRFVGNYRISDCVLISFNFAPPLNFVADYAGYINVDGSQSSSVTSAYTGAKHINTRAQYRLSGLMEDEAGVPIVSNTRRDESPVYRGRRYRGTAAAPADINDQDTLVLLRGEGLLGALWQEFGSAFFRGRSPSANPYGEFVLRLLELTSGTIQDAFIVSATTITPGAHNARDFGRYGARWKDGYTARMYIGASGDAAIYSGTGSPEGTVSAGKGSIYLRQDGSANTTLYVKESGAASSGWVAK
jgi:hypothetical protein